MAAAVEAGRRFRSRHPQHGPCGLAGCHNHRLAGHGFRHLQLQALLFGTAALAPASSGVSGADNPAGDALTVGTLSSALKSQFPQFATAAALQVPVATQSQIQAILRDQLAVVQYQGSTPLAGTACKSGRCWMPCMAPPRHPSHWA